MPGDRSAPLTRPDSPGGAGDRRRPHPAGAATAQDPGGRRQSGSGRGDVVDDEDPPTRHRERPGAEDGPSPAGLGRPPRLRWARETQEAWPRRDTEAPGDRPGEVLGLIERAGPAAGGGGGRPGHDVDRPRQLGPQAPDEAGGQAREGRARVAVLHPGEGLPHRPLIGEHRGPPVDPGWGPATRHRADGGQAPGTDRPPLLATTGATGRQQHLENGT